MKKPLPAASYFGLHLIIGTILLVASAWIFGAIAEDVMNREPLTVVDAQLSTNLHVHAFPRLTTATLAISALHSTVGISCATVALGLYLFWRRRLYWLAALLLSVFGGMMLNVLLKYAFHRARPHFDDPILTLTSYSFPSGHTMMATVLYGVVAAYLIAKTPDWRWRAIVIVLASFLITLVAFSRVYVGAHYLSDVLGAIAEGLAWLSICLTSVYSIWRQNPQRN
ncbi:MAG: phosphatase PAP2 family protein [Acidobacteriota bacterium]|nr:phosphatase PAP2 family protein [Acidobacteriota bacterium]